MDSRHGIYVPHSGPVEILHSEFEIDAIAYIHRKATEGIERPEVWWERLQPMTLPIRKDKAEVCTLYFMHGPDVAENPQARQALFNLVGVHMVITGGAVFLGLSPEAALDAVRNLG